jgi:hypothetical protein
MVRPIADECTENWLRKWGVEINVSKNGTVNKFPNDISGRDSPHQRYKVKLTRNDRTVEFPFYGSSHDFRTFQDPAALDYLLSTMSEATFLEGESITSAADYAEIFFGKGSSDDPVKLNAAQKTYYGLQEMKRKVNVLFSPDELDIAGQEILDCDR